MAIIKVYKNTRKEIDTIPNKIRKQAIYDNIIIEKMDSLKEYLNADRVQIYDFHNGGHYANGRSALKTSCTYETVRNGIKPVQAQLQAIPLPCIAKFISQLLNDTHMKVKNLEEKVKEVTDERNNLSWKLEQAQDKLNELDYGG